MATATNGNGNGNGKHGILATLGDRLMRVLPPAMLVLVLLNIGFIGMAMYVFQHNTDIRNQMLSKIIESCLLQRGKSP